MVNYWLCVTDRVNWQVIRDKLVWGVSDRYKSVIEQVRVGDMLVFYVKPKRICGIFEVASKPYTSTERIFKSGGISGHETFPHRVKLKPVLVPKECLNFELLIPKLKFIKNKERWTGHLRRAMVSIPEQDFELIKKELGAIVLT